MASIYDRFMAETEHACLAGWRAELLSAASGAVLDLGAGTGANVPPMPKVVTRLVLCEPEPHMRRRLAARAGEAQMADASAEQLPFDDESFDVVCCMLVLCTVSNPERALAEVHRVMKPSGKLLFIEHVAARQRPRRFLLQRWCEPVWKHLAENCHLTRDSEEAIEKAGFEFEVLKRESMRKALPIIRTSVRGIARRATSDA
jgi:ubiquinone/menaquinone biosynthesis C-methylase UbiE